MDGMLRSTGRAGEGPLWRQTHHRREGREKGRCSGGTRVPVNVGGGARDDVADASLEDNPLTRFGDHVRDYYQKMIS
ncbi:hypothetical protein L1987_04110 [Smallanthus sonchifolius]|uniref:Uncharacterized protein n=1 Tax=Smallanthus sonchifolius TaxID=185202 RepID=A0ACB9KCL0_9ASTR|nr:hypothetical protein L1987_04110 [Smallanthus sonchifolius]